MHTKTPDIGALPRIAVQAMTLGDEQWGHVAFHVRFSGDPAPEGEALPSICAALVRALSAQLRVMLPQAQIGVRMVDYGWHEGLFHAQMQHKLTDSAQAAGQGGHFPCPASPAQWPPQSPAACGTS